MDKSVSRVTVLHHSAEPRIAKAMTIGTDLSIRTSHSCQILILSHRTQISGFKADMGWKSSDGMTNSAESDQTALQRVV